MSASKSSQKSKKKSDSDSDPELVSKVLIELGINDKGEYYNVETGKIIDVEPVKGEGGLPKIIESPSTKPHDDPQFKAAVKAKANGADAYLPGFPSKVTNNVFEKGYERPVSFFNFKKNGENYSI